MSMRVNQAPVAAPLLSACLLGAPVRPETIQRLADALVHYTALRCKRVVHHVVAYPASDGVLRTTAPSGESGVGTRFRTGPIAGQLLIGVRYQAARPKEGTSDVEIAASLVRDSDAEEIDTVTFTSSDLIADPIDAPAFIPRWAFTPLQPVGLLRPLVIDTDNVLTDVTLGLTATDVRILTVVAFEVPPRFVG